MSPTRLPDSDRQNYLDVLDWILSDSTMTARLGIVEKTSRLAGMTPAFIAVLTKDIEVLQLLLSRGADLEKPRVTGKYFSRKCDLVRGLLEEPSNCEISRGECDLDLNTADSYGNTQLHLFAWHGMTETKDDLGEPWRYYVQNVCYMYPLIDLDTKRPERSIAHQPPTALELIVANEDHKMISILEVKWAKYAYALFMTFSSKATVDPSKSNMRNGKQDNTKEGCIVRLCLESTLALTNLDRLIAGFTELQNLGWQRFFLVLVVPSYLHEGTFVKSLGPLALVLVHVLAPHGEFSSIAEAAAQANNSFNTFTGSPAQTDDVGKTSWNSLRQSVLHILRRLFGLANNDDMRMSPTPALAVLFFYVYMFAVMIVLLNILIAMLTNMFSKLWLIQWAELIMRATRYLTNALCCLQQLVSALMMGIFPLTSLHCVTQTPRKLIWREGSEERPSSAEPDAVLRDIGDTIISRQQQRLTLQGKLTVPGAARWKKQTEVALEANDGVVVNEEQPAIMPEKVDASAAVSYVVPTLMRATPQSILSNWNRNRGVWAARTKREKNPKKRDDTLQLEEEEEERLSAQQQLEVLEEEDRGSAPQPGSIK
ncbi:hypothetical protein BJ742DRAFT_735376 [Cladochytrium replicatum]|nr:hypothetical protein BJ742DRAFT_735376 [Cladochytrium replicatum]